MVSELTSNPNVRVYSGFSLDGIWPYNLVKHNKDIVSVWRVIVISMSAYLAQIGQYLRLSTIK